MPTHVWVIVHFV